VEKTTPVVPNKPVLPPKKKIDPFGAATPADTAAKLRELELKEKDEKEKKAVAEKEAKPLEPVASQPAVQAEAPQHVAEEQLEQPEEKDEHGKASETNKKKREPAVVNSRAAAFESAPTVKREVSQ
jgi:hypothetical protein